MAIWKHKSCAHALSEKALKRAMNAPQCIYCGGRLRELGSETDTELPSCCESCGWWRVYSMSMNNQCIDFSGAIAQLRHLDLQNINQPLNDVRSYLAVKYAKRFELHPRLFEEVVASVFVDLGYSVEVTAYTGDGGIDIILRNSSDRMIGVQVKRFANRIKIEQIHAFTGALLLGRYTQGIYVTTSGYQAGAMKTAKKAAEFGIPIELIDADRFYDALKLTRQPRVYRSVAEWKEDAGIVKKAFYEFEVT